ncbi:MAG TPA: hypothetical protein VF245_10690 [Solirubrobacterales bacterium]
MNLAMSIIARARMRVRLLLASESGMALPTALFAMVASMALASAAVLSSVDVQQGSGRDHDSKEAIAAADSGASLALWRLNRFQDELSAATPCVGPSGETLVASAGWCPETEVEDVGGASFTYRVSAYSATGAYSVIAIGESGEVARRVDVGLVTHSGKNVFAEEKVIGQDTITLEGTPDIRADIGTNGNVEAKGSSTICGDIRVGTGKYKKGSTATPSCGGEVTEGDKDLPEITPPDDIATNNSNCRLALTCADKTAVDTYTKNRSSTKPWDNTHRTIEVASNAKLTMGGGDYFVCKLTVQNGELIMAAGAEIRIFVDTPQHCGYSAGETQVSITGNANIVSTGYNPSQGSYKVPGIYVLGESKVVLTGSSGTNELVLYAPESNIEMGGNATWKGMIAGKSLNMHGTPKIESDPNIKVPDITFASLLERNRYVECTGGTASPPNAYC